MRANLRANAVLKRSDDFAARGIVLRIRGKHEKNIQWQTQRVALNLDIAFLHDVEQPDLNFAREVRQFVDSKDAAIRARKQPVMNGQLVREITPTASRANGIDVADDVSNGHIGSRQLLDKALVARHPGNRCVVALGGNPLSAGS